MKFHKSYVCLILKYLKFIDYIFSQNFYLIFLYYRVYMLFHTLITNALFQLNLYKNGNKVSQIYIKIDLVVLLWSI